MKSFIAATAHMAVLANQASAEEINYGGMVTCMGCKAGVNYLDSLLMSSKVEDAFFNIVAKVCHTVEKLIVHEIISCEQYIDRIARPTFYKFTVNDVLGEERVCNEMLGWCSKPVIREIDLKQTVDEILNNKPSSIQDDNYINNMYAGLVGERETLKAVHLSDIHLDVGYLVGSKANCIDILQGCCRADSGALSPGEIGAREWGEFVCDTPENTLDNVLDYVVSLNPDVLFWTGDNSPHNTAYNTEEEITNYTITATQKIQAKLEGTNITVFPIQGNHDTWPVDIQDFATPNSNWPINHFKSYWSDWLDEQAMTKFGEYGYYSMDFKLKNNKAVPAGSKIIAINSNSCDPHNFDMFEQADRSDPGYQFHWLWQELLAIESDGGIAILIAHYDPGYCMHQWGTRFRALMERFQHIVRFGLGAHEHYEYFQTTNSMTHPDKPVMHHSIVGSITPYFGNGSNPTFMSLDLDAETLLPINKYTHYFDLEKANTEGTPVWEKVDYLDSYKLSDLSPASMMDFARRIKSDKDLAALWEWNKNARVGVMPTEPTDQVKDFCEVATSEVNEAYECVQSKGETVGSPYGKGPSWHSIQGGMSDIIGSWITRN